MNSQKIKISEKWVIFIIGCVLFVDILDFMLVMPLGPDFARALYIDQSLLGWTATSYTLAAAFSGLMCSLFLDKFDHKKSLLVALLGLTLSTLSACFAQNFESLLVARFFAGIFGGPTTSLSFAIIADVFPSEKRGRAIGKAMSAFSCAAVIGVPFSLELSRRFGWQSPFITTFVIGTAVLLLVLFKLPSISSHYINTEKQKILFSIKNILSSKLNILGLVYASLSMMACFMIIPYISAFLQNNIQLPRAYISFLYLFGGFCSFFTMRLAGRIIDITSAYITFIAGISLISFMLIVGFIFNAFNQTNVYFIIAVFVPFMVGVSIRNVSSYTLNTKLPSQRERAGYMALISSFQHISSAIGAYLSSIIMYVNIDGAFVNANIVAIIAIALLIASLFFMYVTEKKLDRDQITT
jgi:predicted MFS family arabinose efflux permease